MRSLIGPNYTWFLKCLFWQSLLNKVKLQIRIQEEIKLLKELMHIVPQIHIFLFPWAWELLPPFFSDAEAAAEEAAAEEDEDEAVAEGDGDGDFPQEEDEGRDSGGYYEDEEPEGEPYESQQTSDSGHSVPDFTADVDIQKSEMMSEEETKPVPEPEPEASVEQQKGDFYGYTCNMKNTL